MSTRPQRVLCHQVWRRRFAPSTAVVSLLLVLGGGIACKKSAPEPVLSEVMTLAQGALRGVSEGQPAEASVLVFRGIPYAAPPVGERRWRPPGGATAWTGERDATKFGPACWQPLPGADSFYGPGPDQRSEDCLFLNVWTAARVPAERRPVMVWIHGGALRTGHGGVDAYDGSALARRGVVLVTINYRLGPLGFLAHPALSQESEHAVSGNYGFLDQIAALQWVRANIARFGGDPGNVTIFGESAGSWSVNALLATPLAKSLFHRAIGESGGQFGLMTPLRGEGSAESAGESWASSFESAKPTTPAELRALSAEQIVEGEPGAASAVVDGWVFPTDIYTAFSQGAWNAVPVLVGSNADEGTTLFGARAPKTKADYEQWIERQYGEMAADFSLVYPAIGDETARYAFLDNLSDRTFGWQMRKWAELATNAGQPAYLYYFSRVPPGADSEEFGSFHAAEILYVFDNLDRRAPRGGGEWEEADRRLATAAASYWVNFATTGDPNGTVLETWPRYSPEQPQALQLGDEIRVVDDLNAERLDVFERWFAAQRQK